MGRSARVRRRGACACFVAARGGCLYGGRVSVRVLEPISLVCSEHHLSGRRAGGTASLSLNSLHRGRLLDSEFPEWLTRFRPTSMPMGPRPSSLYTSMRFGMSWGGGVIAASMGGGPSICEILFAVETGGSMTTGSSWIKRGCTLAHGWHGLMDDCSLRDRSRRLAAPPYRVPSDRSC